MMRHKNRISILLAAVLAFLLLASFPASAIGITSVISNGKTQYKVEVKIETTTSAGGWNDASVEIYYKKENGKGEGTSTYPDCSVSDFEDKGDVCHVNKTCDGFPARIEVYTDFGGGMTWRSWEADVTVYVNDVNVTSKHIYASSSPFSSSDTTNIITIDETKYPYPSTVQFDAPESMDSDGSEALHLITAVMQDQYGVLWTADDPVLTDQETELRTLRTGAGTYSWEVSCKGPLDRKVKYSLKVPTGNTRMGTVERTFHVQYRFPRTLTLTDGSGFKKTLTGYQGEQVSVSAPELEKEGVSLSWIHNGGGAYMPNATGGPKYTFGSEDGTLTAEYKAYTYTVMFLGNGSTSGSMSGRKYTCGNTYTLIANTYSKRGYEFVEWNTKADGTGTAYPNKATVKNLAVTEGAVVNLYAQWKIREYTVTFVNKQTREKITQSVPYGGAAEAPVLSPVSADDESHYIFSKWSKAFDNITANTTVNSTFVKEAHSFRDITPEEAKNLKLGSAGGRYCETCGHFIPEKEEEPAEGEDGTGAGDEKGGTATVVGSGMVWIIVAGGVLAVCAILILYVRKKRGIMNEAEQEETDEEKNEDKIEDKNEDSSGNGGE
jgi:hypothetical protein